ncbi:MAG TPA: DUF4382 domain-containing protein [Desulfurivibrionaceae bacterium]|nr:DUF4382 domain-containing protein [Desulfurivibrionaceae bacterium]
MKPPKRIIGLLFISALLCLGACSSSDNSAGSGPVSLAITDARPMLAAGAETATNLEVTFTEVAVHSPNWGWRSLPLGGETPHTIDLLQFHDGVTTELVPPVLLDYGRYTQIRIMVSEARISFDSGVNWLPLQIPPEHLKTDKTFTFDVTSPAAVKIVADFDLSQSLVVNDVQGVPAYKLKPVLHLVETVQAASISGTINGGSFNGDQAVMITVLAANPAMAAGYEEYTRLALDKSASEDSTGFKIYWLVPDNAYRVEIDFNPATGDGPEYVEEVAAGDLGPGAVFPLNNGVSL